MREVPARHRRCSARARRQANAAQVVQQLRRQRLHAPTPAVVGRFVERLQRRPQCRRRDLASRAAHHRIGPAVVAPVRGPTSRARAARRRSPVLRRTRGRRRRTRPRGSSCSSPCVMGGNRAAPARRWSARPRPHPNPERVPRSRRDGRRPATTGAGPLRISTQNVVDVPPIRPGPKELPRPIGRLLYSAANPAERVLRPCAGETMRRAAPGIQYRADFGPAVGVASVRRPTPARTSVPRPGRIVGALSAAPHASRPPALIPFLKRTLIPALLYAPT